MGIPRLTQDLLPYAQDVILGSGTIDSSTPRICSLVIDGPSLVFYIYHQILSLNNIHQLQGLDSLPTYTSINTALLQFLTDLTQRDVCIEKIYFDGALPVSKHGIRFNRLEKSRQSLETFRRLHPDLSDFGKRPQVRSHSSLVWGSSEPQRNQRALPVPPFIVPCAIECLRNSQWSQKVTVVPGEADAFCAEGAREFNASILTNDSDLVLYQLSQSCYVVPLNSLEVTYDFSIPPQGIIRSKCYQHQHIAEKMSLRSLLSFGFARSRDESASAAIISQRAQLSELHGNAGLEWERFVDEFSLSESNFTLEETANLKNFDPRLSEVFISLGNGDNTVNSYLSVLLEDPDRDSSWAYGRQYRQLAYTVLSHCHKPGKCQRAVTEYSRKGTRISTDTVPVLSSNDAIAGFCNVINQFQDTFGQIEPATSKNSSDLVKTNFYTYTLLALHILISRKLALNKSIDINAARRFLQPVLSAAKKEILHDLTWNDVHLYANIQAVLYSLRMVRQATNWAVADVSTMQHYHHRDSGSGQYTGQSPYMEKLHTIHDLLLEMPPLEILAMNVIEFDNYKNSLSEVWMHEQALKVFSADRSGFDLDVLPQAWRKEVSQVQNDTDSVTIKGGGEEWRTSKISARQSSKNRNKTSTALDPSKAIKMKPSKAERIKNSSLRNMFGLLEDVDD